MRIALLGEVAAWDEDGNPIDLGPPKCRVVLAALALSVGTAVPVPRLVALVWDDQPPRTAEKTVQSYVTRLRKGLGPSSIIRVGAAYRLAVDPWSVDVARFEQRLGRGDISGALQEWGGTPLAGLEASGLDAIVDGLVESWLGAVETGLAHRVTDGDQTAIGALTELTSDHPFREGLWALLMAALYRHGRQADALAAFSRCRTGLIEGLGVEPGPRLRELEAAILAQDDTAVAGLALGVQPGSGREAAETEPSPEGTPPVASPGETDRRPRGTVTFGFCELVPVMAGEQADEPSVATIDGLHQTIRDTVMANNGHLFSVIGDVIGVAFHRATDGLGWATGVQDRLAPDSVGGRPLMAARIGLHTGEAEAHEHGYIGPAVGLAARLASVGHGGQVLVTGTTAELLADDGRQGEPLVELGSFVLEAAAEVRVLQVGPEPFAPIKGEQHRRGNLTRRSPQLIGRDRDLAKLLDLLDQHRLVTLVGPGGIGKTSLATAAAQRIEDRYPGGVWVLTLADISSSDDVAGFAADVMNVNEALGRSSIDGLIEVLVERRVLLILDNSEHVIDGAAAFADAVTARCAEVTILATSREGLGVASERLVAVSPLDADGAAVELFNRRATAASADFQPERHRDHIGEICVRLDGLPLAIELAAARTATLSPADIVARLDDRLRLLAGGRRSTLERHRTLRATIQWSYDLLSPGEQSLFQQLSIFAGPFDLDAAVEVAGTTHPGGHGDDEESDIEVLLGRLVDRSVVVAEPGTHQRRFRLLEAIRDFGSEHLHRFGDPDRTAAAHARWCCGQVNSIRTTLAGPEEADGVANLNELWPDLRAGFNWAESVGDADMARLLIQPIATEIYVRNRNEIGLWAIRLLSLASTGVAGAADATDVGDRVDTVTFAMIWAARRFMRNEDRDGFETMVATHGRRDHPMLQYAEAFLDGDLVGRTRIGPAVVDRLRSEGDGYGADLFEVIGVGLSLLSAGRLSEHDELLASVADRHRRNGSPTCLNWALIFLGLSASAQRRQPEADRYFDEAAAIPLPPRTQTWLKPLASLAAFRRGDRIEGYEIMSDYAAELLEAENIHGARALYGEFIDMMVKAGQLDQAADVSAAVVDGGLLGSAPIGERLKRSMAVVAAYEAEHPDRISALVGAVDDRMILGHIRSVLQDLVEGGGSAFGG